MAGERLPGTAVAREQSRWAHRSTRLPVVRTEHMADAPREARFHPQPIALGPRPGARDRSVDDGAGREVELGGGHRAGPIGGREHGDVGDLVVGRSTTEEQVGGRFVRLAAVVGRAGG